MTFKRLKFKYRNRYYNDDVMLMEQTEKFDIEAALQKCAKKMRKADSYWEAMPLKFVSDGGARIWDIIWAITSHKWILHYIKKTLTETCFKKKIYEIILIQ